MSEMIPVDKLLSCKEAAENLNVKTQTLAAWRCKNTYGLQFVRVGRVIRYRVSELERFISEHTE